MKLFLRLCALFPATKAPWNQPQRIANACRVNNFKLKYACCEKLDGVISHPDPMAS